MIFGRMVCQLIHGLLQLSPNMSIIMNTSKTELT